MPKLMIESSSSDTGATIGGTPRAPVGTKWPQCSECSAPMQFLAQFPLAALGIPSLEAREQALLLFQCQADPGMCDEWDPDGGGNAALLVPLEGAAPLSVPEGETLLDKESQVTFKEYQDASTKETPDDNYCNALETAEGTVLGKAGGQPLWIQADETPTCSCGEKMEFVAQLEDTGGGGINFGDAGAGYAFVCLKCPDSAKFLWQCS